jgi:mRNA-degrading endonuclease RelE of RelBE toxin-antitoxin system
MDRIEKFFRKIGEEEAQKIRAIFVKIWTNDFSDLDVMKIGGEANCYRVRVGDKRIKFIKTQEGNIIYHIGFRDDNTY